MAVVTFRFGDCELNYVLVAWGWDDEFVLQFGWDKNGYLKSGGPKCWRIRKDRDTATGSGEYHYHCEKNGDEYVVKQDGHGSHDTMSGTKLPAKLGDFLHRELKIPLGQEGGTYIVKFMNGSSWDPSPAHTAVEFVNDALNAELA
jgi:hypothetical protein